MFPQGYVDQYGQARINYQYFDEQGRSGWATLFIVVGPEDSLEILQLEAEEFALDQRTSYGQRATIGVIEIVPILPVV
jgi:hypothetical protein